MAPWPAKVAVIPDGGTCLDVCDPPTNSCSPTDGGILCYQLCFGGRRPEGMRASSVRGPALARWLAEMAQLEAASVDAFARLARELRRLAAPPSLIRRAIAAARDEVRHARVTAKLARKAGARPTAPSVTPSRERALVEIAVENAREGCVRETFGALLATWQGEAAGDRELRAAMRAIAADETRHAELAWDVHRWARPLLTRKERSLVDGALRDEAAALVASAAVAAPAELIARAGLPSPAVAAQLAERARHALWS
jgi:hypothetical protein